MVVMVAGALDLERAVVEEETAVGREARAPHAEGQPLGIAHRCTAQHFYDGRIEIGLAGCPALRDRDRRAGGEKG
ncbi:hypothetical protein ES708_32162 [subsurface metagenome]